MNKFTKALTMVSMAVALAVSAMPFSVSAEESTAPISEQTDEQTDTEQGYSFERPYYVVAVKDDYVLLNDDDSEDIYLEQSTYKAMSGNKNDLKFGDVLDIKCQMIYETWPGKFYNITSIKYLGTVSDLYKDSTKDLTVTNKGTGGRCMELKDSAGTVYKWYSYRYAVKELGMDSEIDPNDLHKTDVIRCAVTQRERINYDLQNRPKETVWEVVMPTKIVSQKKFVPSGDANGDGKTDVRDCSLIANKISKGHTDELSEDADFNNDGVINIRDAAALSRHFSKGRK